MTDQQSIQFAGFLWDQGALTRAGVKRFSRVPDCTELLPGDRSAELVKSGDFSAISNHEIADLSQALRLFDSPLDQENPVPLFLGMGSPFDARSWVTHLLGCLEKSRLRGIVIVIPGPAGPARIVPLTGAAVSYGLTLRGCLEDRLGLPPSQITVGSDSGLDRATQELESQTGDLYFVFATQALQLPAGTTDPQPGTAEAISASDTVHLILKDTGLEVSNRTDFAVHLKIQLGGTDGVTLGLLGTGLRSRESVFFSQAELGPISHLQPPVPELRQWSHEAEIVYDGGEQRIHGVEIEYQDSHGATLGTDYFGAPNSHVVSRISTEISAAVGRAAHSMGSRLKQIPKNPGWRAALLQLRSPG